MAKYPDEVRKVRRISKEMIPKILKEKKCSVSYFYEEFQKQNPDLCNDEVKCKCGKNTKRPEWKHQIQWAVADLRYHKKIAYSKKTDKYSLMKI